MWKKDDAPPVETRGTQTAAPARPREADPPATRSRASIGSSIWIRGEVTGDEDLLIEGRVDGSVDLKEHSVTVGADGQVKAGIVGRKVTVEGTVDGDLRASEVIILRSSARVNGDIVAPRVVLEDGATFRGGVEMGDPAKPAPGERKSAREASGAKDAAKPSTPSTTSGAPADPAGSVARGGA